MQEPSKTLLSLFTSTSVDITRALADEVFPLLPGSSGQEPVGSDARPEVYILCRAAWEPIWGVKLAQSLSVIERYCQAKFERSVTKLGPKQLKFALAEISEGSTDQQYWPAVEVEPIEAWRTVLLAVQELERKMEITYPLQGATSRSSESRVEAFCLSLQCFPM